MEIAIHTHASVEEFLLEHQGVELWLKRDDLIHPEISGNKWRKLKYHLEEFYQGSYESILTFGGAYSNHLAATAALGKLAEIPTFALVRGEEEMDSPTLQFCKQQGMELEGMSRSKYRVKEDPDFVALLRELRPGVYILPEGGKGPQALKGCAEIVSELQGDYDAIAVSAGTGATAAGLLAALNADMKLYLYPALRSEPFMMKSIASQLLEYREFYRQKAFANDYLSQHLQIRNDYHFGGYAKINEDLVRFMNETHQQYGLKLDPVYTAKMLFGLLKDIEAGLFKPGAKILALHTGGLQGLAGMNTRLAKAGRTLIEYD